MVPSGAHEKLGSIVPLIAMGIIFLGVAFALVAYLGARFHPLTVVDDPILTMISSEEFRSAVFGVFFAAVFLHWVSHFHSFNLAPNASEKKEVSRANVKPDAEATSGAKDATVAAAASGENAIVGKPASAAEDATEAKTKWLPQKLWVLEGYFLLALFIGGSLGAFETLLSRLNTVKAGVEGVELSLRASASSTTKNLPQLATDNVSSGRLNEPNNAALSLLASLGEVEGDSKPSVISKSSVIMRDSNYLKMENDEVHGAAQRRPNLVEVISTFIAPLAKCQAGLWSATGSDRLSSRTFADLDEPMQELARQVSYNVLDHDEMIENVVKAYVKVASQTIKEAYVDNVLAFGTNNVDDTEKMIAIATKNLRTKEQLKWWLGIRPNQSVSQHCESLRKAFCPDGEFLSIYVPPSPNRPPELVSVASMGQIGIPNPSKLDAAPLNCQSRRTADRQTVEENEISFASRFKTALRTSFDHDEWSGTPYATLIAACVSSIIGENKAAIEEIDSWLSQRINKNWYDVRMKTALASIMESWLTTDEVAASDNVLQEYHLTNLKNVISNIQQMLKRHPYRGSIRTDPNSGLQVLERSHNIWNSNSTSRRLL